MIFNSIIFKKSIFTGGLNGIYTDCIPWAPEAKNVACFNEELKLKIYHHNPSPFSLLFIKIMFHYDFTFGS